MFLSPSNSISCLRMSNEEDKSSSISCMLCPLFSEFTINYRGIGSCGEEHLVVTI